MVGVHNDEHRGVRTAAPDAGGLRPAVQQDADAAGIRVVPCALVHLVTVGLEPGHVLDAQLLVPLRRQETGAGEDRQAATQGGNLRDEADQGLALLVQVPI